MYYVARLKVCRRKRVRLPLWITQQKKEYDKENPDNDKEKIENEAHVFFPSGCQKWPSCSLRAFRRALIAGDTER